LLEGGLATQQMDRELESRGGLGTKQDQQGVNECIRFDERAIQIDAKGPQR